MSLEGFGSGRKMAGVGGSWRRRKREEEKMEERMMAGREVAIRWAGPRLGSTAPHSRARRRQPRTIYSRSDIPDQD